MIALNEFMSALEEVNLLLEEARNALGKAEDSKTAIDKSRELDKANVFLRSGIVLLCGHFEGFLKNILEEFATIVNESNIKIDAAPPLLVQTILSHLLERCKNGGDEHQRRFQLVVLGQEPIVIDLKNISSTKGNPKVDTIDKMLLDVGVPDIIEQLSNKDFGLVTHGKRSQIDPPLRSHILSSLSGKLIKDTDENVLINEIVKHIERKWQPKSERRKVGYVAVIENLLKKRNSIAHGEGDLRITNKELEEFVVQIINLASGLCAALETQIEVICGDKLGLS